MPLTKVTYSMIAGAAVNVLDFGAVGSGLVNDAAAIQAAINSLPNGGDVLLPRGTYLCATGLTLPNAKTRLLGESGSALTYTDATMTLVTIAGADCKLENVTINAPAIFDGTNVTPTYAVVRITGSRNVVSGCTINNVPKVGVFVVDANDAQIIGNYIDGGTSEGFFTGLNTVHFGVLVDPPSTGAQGNVIIANNIIKRCVQGAGSGNLGSPSFEQSFAVTGNVFELCWNHGFYASGLANGHTITGNAFNACQLAVAATGNNHVVSSNTLIVQTTGTGSQNDNEWQGISLRDPKGCVVSNNVIKGEAPNNSVVIGLDDLATVGGANTVANNVVSNNTIEITNTTVAGIVAIRLFSQNNDVKNNIVTGNVIKAPLRDQDGLILLQANLATTSENNTVSDNTVIVNGARGGGYYIYLVNINDSDVAGNRVSLEYDAPSLYVNYGIALGACNRITVRHNKIRCSALYGTNVDYRGIFEATSGSGNFLLDNYFAINTTKLAASSLFQVLTTSGILVEQAETGSPEGVVVAGVGSLWKRTDGGVGSTFYVKESGTSNTGWVAK